MALDDLLDEHEQSERVRSWVRSNALGLIGGVALGLGAIAGWQWWQGQQLQRGMAVNGRYAEVVANYEAGRLPADKGRAALEQIGKGNPTLGTLAALQLAKAQAEAGKRDDAIATLRGLHDLDPDLRAVVNQRLARLLVDAGQGKDALACSMTTRTRPCSMRAATHNSRSAIAPRRARPTSRRWPWWTSAIRSIAC